jgi:hypothetical protein
MKPITKAIIFIICAFITITSVGSIVHSRIFRYNHPKIGDTKDACIEVIFTKDGWMPKEVK